MMDQCKHCVLRGDIAKCEAEPCSHHETWHAETLRAKLAASEQRVKALEKALQTIAEGRGMLQDRSTIYMNGRVPEVPTVFSRRKMQEIAKETLEEACRK